MDGWMDVFGDQKTSVGIPTLAGIGLIPWNRTRVPDSRRVTWLSQL